ncbi:YbaB/EbfC family nucleoid-associated protein [Mycoplasmopsis anatis]|uniref:Nucleoid-associated protein MADP07_00032 n=1 Tax=Mycoplasmopsis anatis TaxID=171279 RepID=A0A9Q3QDX6_9BACT|nr:YbaB/EbfC family nucleoid-associated protein [Mycoplasmopsis anatis]MBW0594671.1 YbaB/EbfC family nucleoid-associated protein [Mycoplasmopsis anatis]MBW0595067.1 YbaB/EbfC family nucleoid-associated protein [Mycoplasmopsis anatis]MBW0595993.1 YbaB/EbfC family nucleoid-associated protein [Mycoplasmopsis anatis]MBW0596636.1 YbaB/EbfC family nucleoid-associated protein [Mycoplasmopsis anatis]MBW0597490.1 YbaB/EbfC family nucleoid-associated protein [Mycoplasmopsis anatis]
MNPEMLKRLRKMQSELEKKQKEFNEKEFVVEKQGVKIVAFGNKKIKSISIDEMLIDPEDKELIEDLIVVAWNELIDEIEEAEEELAPAMPNGLPF